MATTIRCIDCFVITVPDRPGESYRVLRALADRDVDLIAMAVVPAADGGSRITLYPEEGTDLAGAAAEAGLTLDGPYPAVVAQGSDKRGALAELHQRLSEAGVNIRMAAAVTDGRGDYGYIVHVEGDAIPAAVRALDR